MIDIKLKQWILFLLYQDLFIKFSELIPSFFNLLNRPFYKTRDFNIKQINNRELFINMYIHDNLTYSFNCFLIRVARQITIICNLSSNEK